MSRSRLTLGRLMAWIAFAAVNLAVVGAMYRKTSPNYRGLVFGYVAVNLAIFEIFAATTVGLFLMLVSSHQDPARAGHPSELRNNFALLVFVLIVSAVVTCTTLLPILYLLTIG